MCGIIGYVGKRDCSQLLLNGLKRLEYRGYDSAGVAVMGQGEVIVRRCEGKLHRLEASLAETPIKGTIGLGHTRWATHGQPSERNAHPHRAGEIVIIQNGIIENYRDVKERLLTTGHTIKSDTDTELVAHLIEDQVKAGDDLETAVIHASRALKGSFALGVIATRFPDQLIGVRVGPPLIVGIGVDEWFIASDVAAILDQTKQVVFLEDGDLAVLNRTGVRFRRLTGEAIDKQVETVQWTPMQAEKGGFKHFMLKEIHEQPQTVGDSIRGRYQHEQGMVQLDIPTIDSQLGQIQRILISACGTSYYAGCVGKYLLESFARLPVEVDLASELRYRDPLIDNQTLMISISQSGESADTLAAQRLAKAKRGSTLAICNVVGSTIAREAQDVIYLHAGPEISVASTKTFIGTLAILYLVALYLAAHRKTMSVHDRQSALGELLKVPQQIETILMNQQPVEEIAKRFGLFRDFLFLGRGIVYPVALEGALKLKEISYIHAEGYAAGEMKHGPIALIDDQLPVVVLAANDHTLDKTISNVEEVRARNARVIAIVEEGDHRMGGLADETITIPASSWGTKPFLFALPIQLLAYHVAVFKGTDVDQPRNLAKSVTVE